jgi:hypothetical protein
MLDLKKLEINRLIKEFEYLESDYEYKSELIKESSSNFLNSVDEILDTNSDLRIIYEEKNGKGESIYFKEYNDEDSNTEVYNEEEYNKEDTRTDRIKKLYREIVKITHPDKIRNPKLNNLYIEASEYYYLNDMMGIYKICDDLLIDINVDNDDIEFMKSNIDILKQKILFLENSHIWGWYNEIDQKKNNIVLEFIRSKII